MKTQKFLPQRATKNRILTKPKDLNIDTTTVTDCYSAIFSHLCTL